ncbi:ABC transporter permease [Nocardioides bruguierae]|uniref:ABC transporter permease n=1 Tax=Nocardioides bruguierae TaxID=2945102 RepID=A0A9X2IE30_9ACTN|nr:ABC transporter permease [Nocardioides bruguierae]MCL8024149.1 ABC transporter permease [Nocardioides bruguierae]MCM0619852.1 ABC transporter permease [Nocardioides bruguierae]
MSQSALALGNTSRPKKTIDGSRGAYLIDRYGLVVAPFLIAALALVLFLYYQSLDVPNAVTQVRTSLDPEELRAETLRHIEISFLATLLVLVVAIPAGVLLTRPRFRRLAPFVLGIANAGQALPAYGLIVIGLTISGQGVFSVVWTLALFALLPVLRNTMVGLQAVDKNVVEAGRGMGMTKMAILFKIELPLSIPVILAGVRTTIVITIGMAALAFLIGGGGLGITISTGLKLAQDSVLIVGAVLVAIVALTFDWIAACAERLLKPKGL